MIDRTIPSDPYVAPGALDEILDDLRSRGIQPTRLNVIRLAIERGHDNEFAADLAGRIDEDMLAAPMAMVEHLADRRGEHRR